MPTYTFCCEQCSIVFDTFSTYKEYTGKAVCPQCSKETDVRDFRTDLPNGFVKLSDNQVKLGHLASRNSERLSADEKEALRIKHNAYKYEEPHGIKQLPKGMTRMRKANGVEFVPTERPKIKPLSPAQKAKKKRVSK